MRIWGIFWAAFGLVLLVCCVSQTFHDQRFSESEVLSGPTITVTPADPNQFSFAVVGDLHIGSDTSRFRSILQAAQAEGDQFIVCLGDMVDQGELAEYQAYQQAITDLGWQGKVLSLIGNHEIFENGWTHYKSELGPSHYQVTIGNSSFIALDTADGSVGTSQTDWLKAQLAKARPTHTFLLTHYLPTVPGIRTYLRLSDDFEALSLMKIARDAGVSAWMGGHYHSYALGEVEGVKYLLAGGGGGRRMQPITEYFFVQATVSGSSVSFNRRTVE